MNQQQSQGSNQQLKAGMNWFMLVCRALATSVEVFLHDGSTFGERYLGVQSAAAVLIIAVFPIFWSGRDGMPLMHFAVAYLFMCVCVRVRVVNRRWKGGPEVHSYYTGRPHVMRFTGRISETRVKSVVEPLLVWLAGVLMSPLSEPLGAYLVLAGFGLLVSVNLDRVAKRTRALDLHDAMIDQQQVVNRWREVRRDRD